MDWDVIFVRIFDNSDKSHESLIKTSSLMEILAVKETTF